MPEERFWTSTPRKIASLLDIYYEIEQAKYGSKDNSKKKDEPPKPAYIDQVLGW